MVLDEELRPLHELTKEGKEEYSNFLEAVADEILFKHQHPFKWLMQKAKAIVQRQ